MRLVSQAQEFVIEVKIRLFALLHDRSVNLAEIFLTGNTTFRFKIFSLKYILYDRYKIESFTI